MKTQLFLTFLMLQLSFSHAAAAQQEDKQSGNAVMPGCRAAIQGQFNFFSGVCTGNIEALTIADPQICAPQGATRDQADWVVVNWIDQRPERLQEPFLRLAKVALRQAWPCPH